jgi:hypothetical protein
MKKKTPEVRDIERGEILRFLVEFYPDAVTPKMLLYHLDDAALSVSEEALRFHIVYLTQKGFATFELAPKVVGEETEIRSVKVTPAGVDFVDRRKKGEVGIRL